MDKLVKSCLTSLKITTENQTVIEEIDALIQSCKKDLEVSGIKNMLDSDPLIVQAIRLYVKSNFNTSSKDSERLGISYEMLKMSLSLSREYRDV